MAFQKGNQLAKLRGKGEKGPQNLISRIRNACEREAVKGNMVAIRLCLMYFARGAEDRGPVLSDRMAALLGCRQQLMAELALDEQFLAEQTQAEDGQ